MRANKKKKTAATVGAVSLVAALVLTGTYAWNSISQKAKNENIVYANPGGRLHDDWYGADPENGIKRVYVENFTKETYDTTAGSTKEDPNAASIYVRVKLQTYMEYGEEAGVTTKADSENSGQTVNLSNTEMDQRNVKALVSGTKYYDTSTWPVYIYGENDAFQTYFELNTEKNKELSYLPTFNKNKESLLADINGTYAGGTTGKAFGDFKNYDANLTTPAGIPAASSSSVTGNAYYYDADGTSAANPSQEAGDETKHYKNVGESHDIAKTLATEKIITMEEWLDYDGTSDDQKKTGNYWIYDEDGWAYWAAPLKKGEATGPLLTDVKMKKSLGGNCYYAINVTGEFASAGDWGKDDSGAKTGFYKNGITDNALTLLNTLAETSSADWVNITATSSDGATANATTNSITVNPGSTVNLSGNVTLMGDTVAEQGLTWAIDTTATGSTLSGTKLTQAGNTATLAIDPNESPKTIKVTVTPKANPNVKVTYKVKIAKPAKVTLTTTDKTKNVRANAEVNFTKAVLQKDGNAYSNDAVNWKLNGNTSESTKIDNGKLTIGADEKEGSVITVVAESQADTSVSAEAKVTVHPLAETELQKIDAVTVNEDGILDPDTGATDEITIDGNLFYVLAKKDGNALVIKKSIENQTRVFGATQKWESASLRTYLNGEYLDNNPTLKKLAVSTKLKTWSEWDSENTFTNITETEDKVFCLSEADCFGTTNSQTAPADHYMLTKEDTSGGSPVSVGIKLTAPKLDWNGGGYWLRSPRYTASGVSFYYGSSILDFCLFTVTTGGVRPALWISL